MALLEIDQLSFSVPARAVLDRLDLSVEAGEIHALVGTNGTGKSTLAYLIMGCADGIDASIRVARVFCHGNDAIRIHESETDSASVAQFRPHQPRRPRSGA